MIVFVPALALPVFFSILPRGLAPFESRLLFRSQIERKQQPERKRERGRRARRRRRLPERRRPKSSSFLIDAEHSTTTAPRRELTTASEHMRRSPYLPRRSEEEQRRLAGEIEGTAKVVDRESGGRRSRRRRCPSSALAPHALRHSIPTLRLFLREELTAEEYFILAARKKEEEHGEERGEERGESEGRVEESEFFFLLLGVELSSFTIFAKKAFEKPTSSKQNPSSLSLSPATTMKMLSTILFALCAVSAVGECSFQGREREREDV